MDEDTAAPLCDCRATSEGTIQCRRPDGVGCPYEALRQTAPLMTPTVLESLASVPHEPSTPVEIVIGSLEI